LFNSIKSTPGEGKVKISNEVPYASAHQFGETIQTPVTQRMRRFAWAKYYEAGGGVKNPDTKNPNADFWKGLALTKKKRNCRSRCRPVHSWERVPN